MTTHVATPLAGSATATAARAAVPWSTAIILGVVLAYTDGFWITSLREAVGSIERTSAPFSAWLRESTTLAPLYVLAVLAALTLARRRFGTALRGRTLVLGGLLVASFGTIAGILELAISSWFDYGLQMEHLDHMGTMGGLCFQACVDSQRDATLVLQLKSVGIGSVILFASGVVFVGWTLAFMGGRLRVERTVQTTRRGGSRSRDLQLLIAATLVGSALIHLAVVPEHLREWQAAGLFFVALAVAQLAAADLAMAPPRRIVLFGIAGLSTATLLLWAYSRLVGLPFGPEAGHPEAIGLADAASGALELATIVAAVMLLGGHEWAQRPRMSVHRSGLAVMTVVTVTVAGVGAALSMYGSAGVAHGVAHDHAEPPAVVAQG